MATATNGRHHDPEVLEREIMPGLGGLEQQTRGEIDIQIATAKRYPRSLKQFTDESLEMATLNKDIAESCIYAVPRKEDGKVKMIEGPSARFAEICASAWGHMRVEARPVDEDDRFITVRGMAWDLQRNTAIAFEVKRRITTKSGNKFGDDMVSVTSNAAASIAIRNAILKVIPAAFWKPIYLACRQAVAGDLKTLVNRRSNMFEAFQKIGVTKDQVLSLVDVKGTEDIGIEELVTLQGLLTSLKEGEATIAEIFGEKEGARTIQPGQRKSEQPQPAADAAPGGGGSTANTGGSSAAATTPTSAAGAPSSPAPAPSTGDRGSQERQARSREMPSPATGAVGGASPGAPNVGVITDVLRRGNGALVKLNTGFQCATADAATIAACERLRDNKTIVDLDTRANRNDPSKAPVIEGVLPIADGGRS